MLPCVACNKTCSGKTITLTDTCSRLFRHALLAHVDGAIRASNAQYDDPRVLERIDVKILHGSPGDDGWKVFTLDYSVAGTPLNSIITNKGTNTV